MKFYPVSVDLAFKSPMVGRILEVSRSCFCDFSSAPSSDHQPSTPAVFYHRSRNPEAQCTNQRASSMSVFQGSCTSIANRSVRRPRMLRGDLIRIFEITARSHHSVKVLPAENGDGRRSGWWSSELINLGLVRAPAEEEREIRSRCAVII